MTPTEAMYNQLTPENRHRVDQRIDALLLQQEAAGMTINTIDSKERELISIIRNSKDPIKALQIALEVMLKMLEAKQEAWG